jgi:hypothetical protein
LATQSLALVRASGAMQTLITGARDATVCSLLDACGAQGAISWMFMPKSFSGALTAIGPATLPPKAFRVALGIEPGRTDRRIAVLGSADWEERGMMRESISQAGATCSDMTSAGAGFVELNIVARSLHASYGAETDGRTRCPGPELDQLGSATLSGAIPLARTARRFALHLAGHATRRDDGYDVRQSGSLTLTLRRGRLTQRTERY